ncbi:MAG TPA: GTPase RsgA, partial [Armatimonadota bacterium]|nr:GTPase RsgA [Armatimonadota bacterium]
MAANIDTLFLAVGLDDNYRLRRIERYLAVAWQSGADPVVLLTKADLCSQLEERLAEARAVAGIAPIHAVSALTGEGLDALAQYLVPRRTLALLGSSGVGKSTLINHLLGEEVQSTQPVRAGDSKGR